MISRTSIVIWSLSRISGMFLIEMLTKLGEQAIFAIIVFPFSRIPTTLPLSDMLSVNLLNLYYINFNKCKLYAYEKLTKRSSNEIGTSRNVLNPIIN